MLCEEVTRWAGGFCNDDHGEELRYLHGNWRDSLEHAMGSGGGISEVLEGAAKSLPHPRVIAPGELWGEFDAYLEEETYGDFSDRYEGVLDHIQHRVLRPK